MAKKKRAVRRKPKCPSNSNIISEDICIPNHSGLHDEGTVQKTPTDDFDIPNKLYVDGEITGKAWLQAINQTGLTGNKTGSFDLTTTGDISGAIGIFTGGMIVGDGTNNGVINLDADVAGLQQQGVNAYIATDTIQAFDRDLTLFRNNAGTEAGRVSNLNFGFGDDNPMEKVSIGGNLVMPKASGNGIKVDNLVPTFGFADIIGDQFSKNTGATKPTLAVYNGVINSWQFGVGDEAFITYHIPHDYVKGSPIFLHVHWSHIGTFVTGGNVTFKLTSILAKGHNQQAFQSTPSVGTFTGTASTTQYQHILSEILYSDGTPTGLEIDTDNLEPDSVIELTFELDANNITVSEGAVPAPFIHLVDVHYQTTGLIGTKAKAPDFYV